jgi:hypothetical protein
MLSMDGVAVPLWALSLEGRDPERETRGCERRRSRERRRRDGVLKGER